MSSCTARVKRSTDNGEQTTLRSLLPAAKHQRSIHATEREIVVHRVLALKLAALAHKVVEFAAARVEVVQVQRRRKPVVVHHLDGEPGFERTARAERVTEIAFLRADRHARAE